MLDDFGDSKVTVAKSELIAAIRKNRTIHDAEANEVDTGYRAAVTKALDQAQTEVREGKPISVSLQRIASLQVPVRHTKDYDRVLSMLEMSIADQIIVTEVQFRQFVLDDWNWKAEFMSMSSRYKG